ncbi:23S rRNA (uracil(1939)-C(5))-methyltransferase RlmD [Advenella sp. FME57]|uniref:23S rRNA (uracil(1939)-C(5))-methyltransferase RlmD n=1 Tax=Advenella sp. FME57 TaxID=2742604 RepID=UPI001868BC28|nr:23S rRNA (uracil(1939)-C(5))-methyltransferase RlmD [Advenella sp. FME57]
MQETFTIESLDLEARGIARREGKAIFVEGALPAEKVRADIVRRKSSYEIARMTSIVKESNQRVTPRCPSFGTCGGCIMQHLDITAQVAIKQRALEDGFRHIAKMTIPRVLPPLQGPAWGYRYRARLSVRKVIKKGKVLVGFHERKSRYVTDMTECHVLPPYVSAMLVPLRELIGSLSIDDKIPQIEVAVGQATTALLLRHLAPLNAADIEQLDAFSTRHNVVWWLQSKGPDTVRPLHEEQADSLYYLLPQFGLKMPYKPTDFTQVNYFINRSLIAKALNLLDVQADERVADLFCGLGNFTLPLATLAREVVGIEGSSILTDRALQAASQHNLQEKTRFATLNLFEVDVAWLRDLGHFDRMLIDPPREGAQAVALALAQLEPQERPTRIVYVSCNPATLARDAGILVHDGGYKLSAAGVVNMFPHTGHVESIAVFESGSGDVAVATAATA